MIRLLWLAALVAGFVWAKTAHAAGPLSIPSQDGQLQIPAHWFNVEGSDARPVVIGLHGCGGGLDNKGNFAERFVRYGEQFNAERMHFLVIDSFTPRGQRSICGTPSRQRTIRESDRRQDVFAAIDWLVKQPNVDASKIVVLGWSHGGQTVLSVADATDSYVKAQKVQPRLAVLA